ncbi:MAG: hypothetical protein L0Y35_00750 [Flammeovirgaceae bacterium]|nr:hypothetical protein [Flammeovirgaceae bacterium]
MLFIAITFSCSTDPAIEPIPIVPFSDIQIDLNLPKYVALKSDGGVYFDDPDFELAGVKGIILYRKNATTYYAFERNCPFLPYDACSTVDVHSSLIYMQDVCCGSIFNFEGQPTGGPAISPMRKYATSLNGTQLTITDTIIM